jgi:uncharacterized RDD family membrane protein YckC
MLERKGLVIRLVAAIIDSVIAGVVATIAAMVLGSIVSFLGVLVAAAVYVAYPLIEITRAQSPGKMILKLKVTAADGSPATRGQLIERAKLRWLPNAASGVLMVLGLVSPIFSTLASLGLVVLSIALLVLSLKTIQTTMQAYWDVRANTAVMGPVSAPATFAPPVPGVATTVVAVVPPVTPQA